MDHNETPTKGSIMIPSLSPNSEEYKKQMQKELAKNIAIIVGIKAASFLAIYLLGRAARKYVEND